MLIAVSQRQHLRAPRHCAKVCTQATARLAESVNVKIPLAIPKTGVVCDLDGVIYNDSKAVRGAADAISWLQQQDIPYVFLTNTTSMTRAGLAEKLQRMGVDCKPEKIITPAVLAAQWLATHTKGPTALFVADEVVSEFGAVETVDVCGPISPSTEVSAVVVGDLGNQWTYESMNKAFRLLIQNKATLVSLGMSRYYKAADGLSLDVGPFTAGLQFASNCPVVVLGKPDPLTFQMAADGLGIPRDGVVMVGDDIHSDVAAAKRAGLRGVLVRSGKYREGDGGSLDEAEMPDVILDSIAELPSWWSS